MDIFSIDVTPSEVAVMRQALDLIQVSGKDAKFIASLQIKLETEYAQIQQMKANEEARKRAELEVIKTKDKK